MGDIMPIFPPEMHFKGTWRPYQQRVLEDLKNCLEDQKIHIVAAPGSGKTTVGLEILLRLGRPALILAPSITIREQWIDRFISGFLPQGIDPQAWVSNTLRAPKPLTVITYQALHSAYNRLVQRQSEQDEQDEAEGESPQQEAADFQDFDLLATLKSAGICAICLDEAHHLRSEWWKALEQVVEQLGKNVTTVALTATPPYDSSPGEWQRYISLCGEIDTEIFAPELVKEHNLCPHQDYVYFNWPEKDEMESIKAFRQSARDTALSIAQDAQFIKAITSHPGLADPQAYAELFLDKPDYLSAIMVYLNHLHIPFSKALRALIGTTDKLPKLSLGWMQLLLQGFLYEDASSYAAFAPLQESIRTQLSKQGHIKRKKVLLNNSDEINRMLITSKGKLGSICQIVRAEYQSMGGDLRLLVLTDYIKKNMMGLIAKEDAPIQSIGVVPIFEVLRREGIQGLKLGVLSGGVVIIPSEGAAALDEIAAQRGVQVRYKAINSPDYVEADFSGSSQKQMVGIMTEFFTQGGVQVLIGTKSLLGEGWDSPCINALILASFVGSYMLSNQMRGRAIRVFPAVADKTANIWHLVSMEPPWAYLDNAQQRALSHLQAGQGMYDTPLSEDYETLRRRFRAFLGVSYTRDVIEDGIDRLCIIKPPFDQKNIQHINQQMLQMATDRHLLKQKWQRAIDHCPDVSQVIQISTVDKALVPHGYVLHNALARMLTLATLEGVVSTLAGVGRTVFRGSSEGMFLYVALIALIPYLGFGLIKAMIQVYRYSTPQRYLKQMGMAVLGALKTVGLVDSYNAKVITQNMDQYTTACFLEGGTTYEKNTFSDCMAQLMGRIDNPRYLLVRQQKRGLFKSRQYFAVPELLGTKKENAEALMQQMNKHAGSFSIVFTRNAQGRKNLLEARAKSFGNKNDALINQNHRVKGKWE